METLGPGLELQVGTGTPGTSMELEVLD